MTPFEEYQALGTATGPMEAHEVAEMLQNKRAKHDGLDGTPVGDMRPSRRAVEVANLIARVVM